MSAESATARDRARPAAAPTSASPAPRGLVQRRCACGGKPGIGGECAECRKKRLGVQTKLRVGRPGDRWEREADAAAERMLAAPEPASAGQPPAVQRSAAAGGGGRQLGLGSGGGAGRQLGLGSGRPLGDAVRRRLEAGAGRDFSGVRVHTGERADELARGFSARAFTLGGDVAFARGEFRPASRDGLRLLAHELTHTAQQGASPARAAASPMTVGSAPPGTVQRQVDCSTAAPRFNCPATPDNDRFEVVDIVRTLATRDVGVAAGLLQTGDVETAAFGNRNLLPAFESFFGSWTDAQRVNEVGTRLRTIESTMIGAQQPTLVPGSPNPLRCANECEPTCSGNRAFYSPTDGRSIYFCEPFFEKETVEQKATFIHELTHAALRGDEVDVYSYTRLFELAGEEPTSDPNASSIGAINPDSITGFVLAVSGVPLAEARTLKGEQPDDRFARFDDESEEVAARRALAYAELVARESEDHLDDLEGIFGLFQAGETWDQLAQRLARRPIAYNRSTMHLLRGMSVDQAGNLPPGRNATCTASSRFPLGCPSNGHAPWSGDRSTVEAIGRNLGRVRRVFSSDAGLVVRRGRQAGEEADFRQRAWLSRDRLRLSDDFFALDTRAQIFAILEAVVRGLGLPRPGDYTIFLRRDARRSLTEFTVF
ncbi:MAG TPA: DUF4157 domain-containing protein [Thermoanaerobaculia bacterium]|nr:DUF4157 domain-containing protein [Thermoanaerobaculia bacterium]